jgi:hypothetical protein
VSSKTKSGFGSAILESGVLAREGGLVATMLRIITTISGASASDLLTLDSTLNPPQSMVLHSQRLQ